MSDETSLNAVVNYTQVNMSAKRVGLQMTVHSQQLIIIIVSVA